MSDGWGKDWLTTHGHSVLSNCGWLVSSTTTYPSLETNLMNKNCYHKMFIDAANFIRPKIFKMYSAEYTHTVFCPGYLEWWLDSTLLFIPNPVSVAYICIIRELDNSSEWWLFPTSADQCGQNNVCQKHHNTVTLIIFCLSIGNNYCLTIVVSNSQVHQLLLKLLLNYSRVKTKLLNNNCTV